MKAMNKIVAQKKLFNHIIIVDGLLLYCHNIICNPTLVYGVRKSGSKLPCQTIYLN